MPSSSIAPDPVLIAGAGPTGLTLGIELLRRGVACRVIDRAEGPARTSRSFTLHARTLELFDMAGYADRFLAHGMPSVSMDYHFDGVPHAARLDFTQLDSRFPYVLIISQSDTERILREQFAALGGVVEWRTELKSAASSGDGTIHAVLESNSGATTVTTLWLAGCDGLHSTVRTQLGIGFEGDEYTGMQMRMMDVPLRGFPLSHDRIHYLISTDRMVLVTKLPGDNYRVLISDMGGSTQISTAREDFQLALDGHFGGEVTVGEPSWTSVFTIWRRISAAYRDGGIFMCGDAAHIHSPAGGQGMNACIQDAFNLGWKLASVSNGQAPESLLDSYERERRPIAAQVIEGTHLLHAVIMAHGQSIAERLAITQEPGFNQRAVQQISGISYTYRDPGEPSTALAPGDRIPDTGLAPQLRLHDLLRHPSYTALLIGREAGRQTDALASAITARFGNLVKVVIFEALSAPSSGSADVRVSEEVYTRFGITDATKLYLVRPDGYLGLCESRTNQPGAVLAALDRALSGSKAAG